MRRKRGKIVSRLLGFLTVVGNQDRGEINHEEGTMWGGARWPPESLNLKCSEPGRHRVS